MQELRQPDENNQHTRQNSDQPMIFEGTKLDRFAPQKAESDFTDTMVVEKFNKSGKGIESTPEQMLGSINDGDNEVTNVKDVKFDFKANKAASQS